MEVKKIRKSNFELLRIISMIFIVLWHVIDRGNVLTNSQNPTFSVIVEFLKMLIVIHVNSFVLLTGYFQNKVKFRLSKVLSILLQCLFYTIIIMIVMVKLDLITLSKVDIIKNIFINFIGEYWFINIYILLYCFSPILNIIINSIDQKKYKKILITCFILLSVIPFISGNKFFFNNSGFSLANFILLYFIGAYINRYPVKESYLFKNITEKCYCLILFILYSFFAISNFCILKTSMQLIHTNHVFAEIFNNFITEAYHYENPIIIVQSIFFFLMFEKMNIKSRLINKISSLTLGVYIIHENMYLRFKIPVWLKIDNGPIYSLKFIFYMLFMTMIIFILATIIDCIRQAIFDFIYNRKVSLNLRNKIKNYFKDLGLNISW